MSRFDTNIGDDYISMNINYVNDPRDRNSDREEISTT